MTDLVRFTLCEALCNRTQTATAAARAFAMSLGQAYDALQNEAVVLCRPEQYARFIIQRGIRDVGYFKAEFVTPVQYPIDVSQNP